MYILYMYITYIYIYIHTLYDMDNRYTPNTHWLFLMISAGGRCCCVAGPFEGAVIAQDRGTGKSLVDTPDIQHISRLVFHWDLGKQT